MNKLLLRTVQQSVILFFALYIDIYLYVEFKMSNLLPS